MGKYLFIVETPFQLLCAYEYLNLKKINPKIVIRKSSVGANDFQIDSMLGDMGRLDAVQIIIRPRRAMDFFKCVLKLLPIFFVNYEEVVLGSYFSGVQRKIARLVSKRGVVLLDDGVASVLADKVISEKEPGVYSAFSIFPLRAASYRRVESNSFKAVSERYDCYVQEDLSCFFIGQSLVDIGAIDMDSYVRAVKVCAEATNGSMLNYIPHRTESAECIDMVKKIDGVRVFPTDCAIEYYMLKERIKPVNVYSVISTALYSIATIYPDSGVFCVQPKRLKSSMFEHYGDIVRIFKEHPNGICFLDVE
ncbi:hypothetical protein D3C78_935820 [compost metagenome]